MSINQTITKTEISALEKQFSSVFKRNYYIGIILLLIAVAFSVGSVYYAFEYFAAKNISRGLLFVMYFALSCWFLRILIYNYRVKESFKYTKILNQLIYPSDSYNVCADDEAVTVDEKIIVNWKDLAAVFLCGDYVVLSSFKKLAFVLRVTAEEKNQICQIMNANKKAIVILDKNKEYEKYNQKTIEKTRKKTGLIFIVLVVVLVVVASKSVVPTIPVVNNSGISSSKPDFNPELDFNGQMSNALDTEGTTGFNFDAAYMFDIYTEYIKYRFNTAVIEYDDASADKKLWFFDGENVKFGFDTVQSQGNGKRQISYFKGENALAINEKNGQPYAEKEAYQMKNWDDTFAELMLKDYTMSKYPKLETFGGSGSNYFYAKFRNNGGKAITYSFGENYMLCVEYRGNKIIDSTLVVFTYKSEDKLDYTEELFDAVLTESEKPQSEQNIDFEFLLEDIEKYCDYKVNKDT
ncbi:MAG: hypothetical protein E7483_05360 [Ruminococcaceae bacterium]|nr:hypothetical protein [Oscillospiraceae bacterium]